MRLPAPCTDFSPLEPAFCYFLYTFDYCVFVINFVSDTPFYISFPSFIHLHLLESFHLCDLGYFPTDGHNLKAVNITERKPVGVVALVTPWNLPLYLLTWKGAHVHQEKENNMGVEENSVVLCSVLPR